MAVVARRLATYQDYLDAEVSTGVKHEFLDGGFVAMAGGTPAHAALATRMAAMLDAGLAGRPCRPFNSDLKVRVPETGLATYPDATVVCGKLSLDEEDPNAVTNPSVITEVLSVSTEGYDRGEKWSHYQLLASLREYVLVSSERVRVEVFRRVSGGEWTYSTHGPGEVVILPSLGVQLPVDALYEGWEELRAAEGGLPQQRPAL